MHPHQNDEEIPISRSNSDSSLQQDEEKFPDWSSTSDFCLEQDDEENADSSSDSDFSLEQDEEEFPIAWSNSDLSVEQDEIEFPGSSRSSGTVSPEQEEDEEEEQQEEEAHSDIRPRVNVTIGGTVYRALIDTGASRSYIGESVASWCEENHVEIVHPVSGEIVADCRNVPLEIGYRMPITVYDRHVEHEFFYLSGMAQDVVLGIDFLDYMRINIICGARKLAINDEVRESEQI